MMKRATVPESRWTLAIFPRRVCLITIDDLCTAVFEENLDQVEKLVAGDLDLNACGALGCSPLMHAAESESTCIAKFLIERGADVNFAGAQGVTALHLAVDISIDGIIQNGGSPGDEPLEMIQFLLENGADIRKMDLAGKTALDWAESYESPKVIAVLQRHCAE